MSDGFSLSDAFGVDPPFFVRKVDRRGHWEDARQILANVFPVDEHGRISVYRVEAVRDLMRLAVALNANRVATNPQGASLTEPLLLVAIREGEFLGIQLRQINGLTACLHANRRHYDAIIPSDAKDAHARLVDSLLASGREPYKLSKRKLKQAVTEAKENGCYAVVEDSARCTCEENGLRS
ncbi:MAG: hypothetical protein JXB62_15780 [Pirellulales bacterium]|nr:hypothetical protein [Pirellulales bacterium]